MMNIRPTPIFNTAVEVIGHVYFPIPSSLMCAAFSDVWDSERLQMAEVIPGNCDFYISVFCCNSDSVLHHFQDSIT